MNRASGGHGRAGGGRPGACGRVALLGLAAGLALLASCNGDRAGALGERERGQVAAEAESVIDGFFAATNAGDVDGVLAHYHPGEELIQIACTEVRTGYSRVESVVRMWHEDQAPTLEYRVARAEALDGNAAVVAAQGRNARGEALFWTLVLQRDAGGEWRIVQEHQSWAGCREPRIRMHD